MIQTVELVLGFSGARGSGRLDNPFPFDPHDVVLPGCRPARQKTLGDARASGSQSGGYRPGDTGHTDTAANYAVILDRNTERETMISPKIIK